MKIKICLFFILIKGCTLYGQLKTDTIFLSLPDDTVFVQTIQYDDVTYKKFKTDKKYDYYHAKLEGEPLINRLRQWLYEHVNLDLTETQTKAIFWIFVVIAVVSIVLILYFFKPSLFYVNKKKKISFSIDNENIHELDFDYLIKDALYNKQYTNAIRWCYLQMLKILHEKDLISYQAQKTVIEYVYEIKQSGLKSSFKEASQQFLYYRYGNFEASFENWEYFSSLSVKIVKQI